MLGSLDPSSSLLEHHVTGESVASLESSHCVRLRVGRDWTVEEKKRREEGELGEEEGGVGVESMPRIDYRITITITFHQQYWRSPPMLISCINYEYAMVKIVV